jgi:hypothetical protein
MPNRYSEIGPRFIVLLPSVLKRYFHVTSECRYDSELAKDYIYTRENRCLACWFPLCFTVKEFAFGLSRVMLPSQYYFAMHLKIHYWHDFVSFLSSSTT